ncbi:M20 family metallo-hydrolase [Saccharospirillum impatiens]|uniref:M20 family metallo-hydrolase n=1 Tax=Saccharospirillum impatiens TaxID=169438 RepID=UPI00041E57CE|nr:M20 family metallo-hydrolase [Saccharospirillum impatiens]
MSLGKRIMDWSAQAARHSEPGPGVTRLLGSPEHKALLADLDGWMQQAGLSTELDGAGNLVGRTRHQPGLKTLIIGSHQDTVRQGGAFDGMLGILLPLAVLQQLHEQAVTLPVNVELIAFSDEEGARFSSTLVGSSALAGTFNPDILKATDRDGVTLESALRGLGANPDQIPALKRDPSKLAGFLEIHIEQGPVLESLDLPVGVVSAITGIERHKVHITGKAGHAGTTPMHLRQDALLAATEVVRAVNDLCQNTEELVGVVGELNVTPNAVNVIPSAVELTIELRSPVTRIRETARQQLLAQLNERIAGHACQWTHERVYEQQEVDCSPAIQQQLANAIATCGWQPHTLFSGAGHDGLAMAKATPIGMLFVRCTGGLSHHPEEAIIEADADAAAEVIKLAILNWEAPV